VDSVLNQSYSNIELILVDDGSNTITKNVLKSIVHPRVTIYEQVNNGQSSARNFGVSKSHGDYIFILDSDDFIEKNLIENAIRKITSSQSHRLVTCATNVINSNGSFSTYKPKGGFLSDFLLTNNACGGCCMFRKSDWLLCGKYDEQMKSGFEDWEFFIRLLSIGGECIVLNQIGYNYRKRVDSTTSIANTKRFELIEYIYIKNQKLYQDNFEMFIKFILKQMVKEQDNKLKIFNKKEYLLGSFMLRPLRFLKKLIN